MKRIRKGPWMFTGLLVGLTLILVIASFSYDPKARLIPLLVAIPTLLIGVFVLISETFYPRLLKSLDVSVLDFGGKVPSKAGVSEEPSKAGKGIGLLGISIWLVGYFILVYLVGFLIATAVFLLTFLKVAAKVGWLKTTVISVVVWGFIYGVFEVFMNFELFRGILFGAIVPSI